MSLYYFLAIDELLQKYINLRKKLLILSFVPLIFALLSFALYHPYWNQEDAKFTANQAVQFAVSGKGTYNSLFPDELNKVIETKIDGYLVTRSTDVEKIGSGDYKIKLIEKWQKTGENGERITYYHVQRKEGGTSSGAAGSSGDTIPYKH